MADALVTHPHFGSVWLEDAYIDPEMPSRVVGTVYEPAPDTYHRIPTTMNFPTTCIRKWEVPVPPNDSLRPQQKEEK